jgi:ectoine hydroxylase-related dioxygenase (phytanoyl-CoA dioxygenase family)
MSWSSLGPETPFTSSLLEDSRIINTVESLFGSEFYGISCNASSLIGETNWHPDVEREHLHALKMLFYLQPLDGDNGALRVIPGAHLNPLHDDIKKIEMREPEHDGLTYVAAVTDSDSGLHVDEVPAAICSVNPGDLVVFDLRLWHASSKGSNDRRMISMVFIKHATTAEEEEAISFTVRKTRRNRAIRMKAAYGKKALQHSEYHPDWLANSDNNPMRQHWINWMREKGYFEPYSVS